MPRRLTDAETRSVMDAAGLRPLELYPGTKEPWRCKCQAYGEEATLTYGNVQSGQGGSGACAVTGFDPVAPAVVYLITHQQLSAAKIGITGADIQTDRITQHEREGWVVVGAWNVAYGRQAEEIETEILRWWREELDAPRAVTADLMPQGGYTETVSLKKISLEETARRIWRLAAQS
ncbi:MAG: hypothetical protein HOH36_11590 [Acidimicrobiaceae bacterium]|jgi:uncharacterized membrane protein|nr:hypothetical protein [Acidimicrobiaceae bacterium]MBT5851069.1 hypothetical protein [Acidimicrobiaceae bacterium]